MSGNVIFAESGTLRLAPASVQVGRRAAWLVLQVLDAGEEGLAFERAVRTVAGQQQEQRQKNNNDPTPS